MSALAGAIKVIAGPIGQTAAIVAAILGPRPLQLAACAFGLFTAANLLAVPLFGNCHATSLLFFVALPIGVGVALCGA